MISEAFVQQLTNIKERIELPKTCSQARHYAFSEVEKVCHIILLTWIEKNRKKKEKMDFLLLCCEWVFLVVVNKCISSKLGLSGGGFWTDMIPANLDLHM